MYKENPVKAISDFIKANNIEPSILRDKIGFINKYESNGIKIYEILKFGCNMHCPNCNEPDFVDFNVYKDISIENLMTLEEIMTYLLTKNVNRFSDIKITGGEPLCNSTITAILIRFIHYIGLTVQLCTNGSNSLELKNLFANSNTSPNLINIDIKTDLQNYYKLFNCVKSTEVFAYAHQLENSIDLVSILPCSMVTFTTVLVPTLVTIDNISELSKSIPYNMNWYLLRFEKGKCYDREYNSVRSYTKEESEFIRRKAVEARPSGTDTNKIILV